MDEVRCIGLQVAALEKRMDDLRIGMGPAESLGGPETGELVSIRREYTRTRGRLTAISQFEERLRRLEGNAG